MRRSALRIAAIYACMALVWIAFSDQLIAIFVRNLATATHIQTFKGTGFVGLTTLVLCRLINRAMQRLEASERRYRMLFEASPDAVFVVDAQGRYVDANNAALTLSGYSQAELQGRSIADVIMGAKSGLLQALARPPSACHVSPASLRRSPLMRPARVARWPDVASGPGWTPNFVQND